jgi:hypothetical protein
VKTSDDFWRLLMTSDAGHAARFLTHVECSAVFRCF